MWLKKRPSATFVVAIVLFFCAAAQADTVIEEWVARYNGPGNGGDETYAIAVDDSGNVYVTGESYGDGPYGDYATIKYGPDSNEPLWVARYNGPGNDADAGFAIAVDNLGNVYVTGRSWGDGAMVDYATIKYGPDSNEPLWVARYNGPGNHHDYAEAIAVDSSGNVYVTGESRNSYTLGDTDYATIKYNTDGDEVWVARYNGPGDSSDWAEAIDIDDSDNIYVTGLSVGIGTAGDYATVKYSPDSNEPVWVARYNGPGDSTDWAEAIAIDDSGNIYVTGGSEGIGTDFDYATIKYSPDSNEPLWIARYNGPENEDDGAYAIAVDDSNNVYVTGRVNWVGGVGGSDYATIKYDPNGDELWVSRYDGPGNDTDLALAIAVDDLNNVYVTGYSEGDGTGQDYATIKYGPDSNEPLWIARYNGPGNGSDQAWGIAIDDWRYVYVTGDSVGDGTGGDYATIKYSQVTAVDWWPMFRHDPKHTARSPVVGAQEANVKWTFTAGDVIRSSPAIAEDGTIYVGSNDANMYAINPDGTLKWSCGIAGIGGVVCSSPAIGSDGTIYVGTSRQDGEYCQGKVYAIDPNGTVKWSFTTDGDVSSSPTIDPLSGVIYVGATCQSPSRGRMYAFDPNGTLKWEFNPGSSGWIKASPAIREDGTILFGDYTNPDGIFWALNPNSTVLWQREIPNPGGEIDIDSSAAVDSNGMIYFGGSNANRRLWALDPNGTIIWWYDTGDIVSSSPAIGPDGTIYVGSYDGELYAIDPNSSLKWTYVTGAEIYSSPAVGADGTIYVGSKDNNMYAIDPNGTLKWSYTTGAGIWSSPAIGCDGTVYVGSYDNKLYAFGLGSLHLLSPNGGQCLLSGTNYSIQWETLGVISDVRIEYSTNSGLTWTGVDPCNTGNTGTYNWLLPNVNSSRCLVRISDANDANDIDTSDHTFTICECLRSIADLNNDCYVEFADFAVFGDWWLATNCGDSNWCAGTDLDRSGDINWQDLRIFAHAWLLCGNCYDPACGLLPPLVWLDCWDYPTQCHGDGASSPRGPWHGLPDGVVDAWDMSKLILHWNTIYPDPDYDACADFNRDGSVDWIDYDIVAYWWTAQTGEFPPADCPTAP